MNTYSIPSLWSVNGTSYGTGQVGKEPASDIFVVIGYVNSAVGVLNEARLPFKSKEGSLKLSIKRDIITEDILGCLIAH